MPVSRKKNHPDHGSEAAVRSVANDEDLSSKNILIERPRDLFLALVESKCAYDQSLESRLVRMGYRPMVFADVADLVTALGGELHFDLLLLTLQDELTLKRLSEMCKSMPILLVVQEGQWGCLLTRGLAQVDALGFDASRTRDEELEWRMRVLSEREYENMPMQLLQETETVWGDYEFLSDCRTVLHGHRQIILQPREFAFALKLFRNIGRVLTRDRLWNSLWKDTPLREGTRALDVCAANLRRKLDLREKSDSGFVLRAEYKRGYQLISVVRSQRHRGGERLLCQITETHLVRRSGNQL